TRGLPGVLPRERADIFWSVLRPHRRVREDRGCLLPAIGPGRDPRPARRHQAGPPRQGIARTGGAHARPKERDPFRRGSDVVVADRAVHEAGPSVSAYDADRDPVRRIGRALRWVVPWIVIPAILGAFVSS